MTAQRVADADGAAKSGQEGPLWDAAARIGAVVQQLPPALTGGLADYREDPAAALGTRLGWPATNSYRRNFRPSFFGHKEGFSGNKAKLLADHLRAAVIGIGGTLSVPDRSWSPEWTDEARKELQAWLDDAMARFEQAIDRVLEPGAESGTQSAISLLESPAWRHVDRPALLGTVRGMLARRGRAGIIGASGTGKSYLARTVAAATATRTLWLAAPKPIGGQPPSMPGFASMATEILLWLAAQVPETEARLESFRLAFKGFQASIGSYVPLTSRDTVGLQEAIESGRPRLIISVLAPFLPNVTDLRPLAMIASVLAQALPERRSGPLPLVVLDDIWVNPQAVPLGRFLDALVPRDGAHRMSLLVTSQHRYAAFGGDPVEPEISSACTVELDRDEPDRERVALAIVAAWGAPGKEAITAAEAGRRIEAFQAEKRLLPGNAAPPGSEAAIIRQVLRDCLGWHPLGAALLASLWRQRGHDVRVWRDVAGAVANGQAIRWWFEEAGRGDLPTMADTEAEILNREHLNVTEALLRAVARGGLPEADFERYLDLITHRRDSGQPLNPTLYEHVWSRVERQGRFFSLIADGPVLERFADLMLVQTRHKEGGGSSDRVVYELHDMHRRAIEAKLHERGLDASSRHAELLMATGLLVPDGHLMLDEEADFRDEGGDPDVPHSHRRRLHVRLRPRPGAGTEPVSDDERRQISRYFMDELIHHVRAVKRLPGHAGVERELLSTFSFLQCQLDWEEVTPAPE